MSSEVTSFPGLEIDRGPKLIPPYVRRSDSGGYWISFGVTVAIRSLGLASETRLCPELSGQYGRESLVETHIADCRRFQANLPNKRTDKSYDSERAAFLWEAPPRYASLSPRRHDLA